MKKSVKIVLVLVIVVILSTLLVACGKVTNEVDGVYYNVNKKEETVEKLTVSGENVEVIIVSYSALSKEEKEEIGQINTQKIELLISEKVANNDYKQEKGTCTYENNAFVEKRLDVKYTDGKSGSQYIYLKDAQFAYSPKMAQILIYAVIGFCVTLVVLCVLMGVIKLLGFSVDKVSQKVNEKKASKQSESDDSPKEIKLAKGSAGELKLENVTERDAAMIMAIVADELGEPLNTLRFISIKDITDQDKE